MLPKCDAKDPEGSGCDDQEIAYVAKMIAKGGEAVEKELARLEGMQGSAMKADKKAWLAKRVHILKGLAAWAPALSDFRPDAGADDGASVPTRTGARPDRERPPGGPPYRGGQSSEFPVPSRVRARVYLDVHRGCPRRPCHCRGGLRHRAGVSRASNCKLPRGDGVSGKSLARVGQFVTL